MKKLLFLNIFLSLVGLIFIPRGYAIKHIIMQSDFTFNPYDLPDVMVGDTVRWVWTSGFHTTTSNDIPPGADTWDHVLSSGSTFFEYKVQIPGDYNYHCVPHAAFGMTGVFHAIAPGNTINGILSYNNTESTGIPNATILLFDITENLVNTSTTNSSGAYTFTDIPDGQYSLSVLPTLPWGGVNATDALATLRHFVQLATLTGMRWEAADVDNSGFINSLDALNISKRFVGITSSFPTGDWYFQTVSLNVSGNTSHQVNFQGICYGDADGSYSGFGDKMAPALTVEHHETRMIRAGQLLTVPVAFSQSALLGAVSLVIPLPLSAFTVKSVQIPADQGFLSYSHQQDELRISWFGLSPLAVKPGVPTLFIQMQSYISMENGFHWVPEIISNSEISDADNLPVTGQTVIIPSLKSTQAAVKHIITQVGFIFSPDEVENVMLGDTIEWIWTSGFHTTTSTTIPSGAAVWDEFLSSTMVSYTYLPMVPGEYNYVCTPHVSLGMTGKFTVEDATTAITDPGIAGTNDFQILSNPVCDEVCRISYYSGRSGKMNIRVFSMPGREVASKSFIANPGVNLISVDLSGIHDGVYFVQLWGNGKKQSSKKVVKK